MPVLETRAYAKLNLSLDVLDRRSDGYHEMRMVMQTVIIEITPRKNNVGIIDMRYADAVFVTNSVDLPIGREPYKSALRLLCRYE